MKTHWKKVFNSDYLSSADLEDGKDLKAVIKNVTVQEVKGPDGKKQERNVATFTDSKLKPMILNVTNSKVIKKFVTSVFIEDWNNIPVQIYVQDGIKAFGELTEGLRIRSVQPSMAKPKLKRDMPAWANAVKFIKEGKPIEDIEAKYDLSECKDDLIRESV